MLCIFYHVIIFAVEKEQFGFKGRKDPCHLTLLDQGNCIEAIAFICNYKNISRTKFASEACLLYLPSSVVSLVRIYYQSPSTNCQNLK